MKDGLSSPWLRLFTAFVVTLLLNTYAGGHQLVAAWAEARDVREHNALVLGRLKLPDPVTRPEIEARKARAHAQIAKTRAAQRARQAAGLDELREASAVTWMAQDEANVAAVSLGLTDIADAVEGILRGHRSDDALVADGLKLSAAAENTLALTARLDGRGALAPVHVARIREALAPAADLATQPSPEEVVAVAEALEGSLRQAVREGVEAARLRFGEGRGQRLSAHAPPAVDPLTGLPGRPVVEPYRWDVDAVEIHPPASSGAQWRERFAGAPALRVGAPDGARLDPPEAGDLDASLDAPLNDAIRAKAAELGGDPRAMYRFVADEVDYGIYAGSVHGAMGTLDTSYGNDVDQASLLIALFRASNIPARYETGTVRMTSAQVAATTGIQDVYTAYQTLANQGVACVILVDGGAYTGIQLERTWVSAWLPYTNYRGVPGVGDGGEGQWVRLDPAFKDYHIEQRFDVAKDVDFDADAFLSQPTFVSPLAFYDEQLRDHFAQTGTRCENLDDTVAHLVHRPNGLDILPHTLPYEIVGETARTPALTDAQRLKVEAELVSSWGFTLMDVEISAVEAYGETFALTFPSGDTLYSATSGQVKPTLSLGGVILQQVAPTSVGLSFNLYVTTRVPKGKSLTKRHRAVAGAGYSINVHTGPVGPRLVFEAESELRRLMETGAAQNRQELALAKLAGLRFAAQGFEDGQRMFAMNRWIPYAVDESLTGTNLIPNAPFGFPVGAIYGGMLIDAQTFFFAMPMEGRREEATQGRIAEVTGYNGSFLEHRIWEEVTGVEFGSSTNILQWAREEGQAIHTLTSLEEYEAIQGDLHHAGQVLADVENALAKGFEVIISDRSVIRGDANVSGYILRDPVSGAGQFLITGGQGGGLQTIFKWLAALVQAVWDFLVCNYPVASSVDAGTGCLSDTSFEMLLFAHSQRRSVAFSYQSDQTRPSDVGGGWAWSFGMRLFPDASTGEVTLLYEDGFLGAFTPDGQGGYAPPYRQHDHMEARAGGGWTITRRDQTVWTFDAQGLFTSETDPRGNVLTLTRDANGRPATLKDEDGATLLTLTADGEGHLTQLVDAVGRKVTLSYVDGRLATVKDPRGGSWSYGYDGMGRLIRRVDPASEPTTYGYDAEGRLSRYTTPSGEDGFIAYDALNRRTVLEDATGAERLFDMTQDGDIAAFIDPVGNKTTYTWEDGELTGIADPRGGGLSRTYDGEGNLLAATDTSGDVVDVTWDENNRPTSYTKGGDTTTLTWDGGGPGNLTMASSDGQVATFLTDADGRLTSLRGGDGVAMDLTWDADGSLASTTDGEGNTTTYDMDVGGRVHQVDQPGAGTWTFTWDGGDRLAGVVSPTGATYAMSWTSHGDLASLTHPDGVTETWRYDGRWLLSHTDVSGGTTLYRRDAEGRAVEIVEPSGARLSVTRDAAGRIASLTDRYGNVAEVGYCAELTATPCDLIDPLGNLTQRLFDDKGRLVEEADGRGSSSFEYDDFGHLLAMVDRLGQRTEYRWGERGDLEQVIDALGQTTTYTWDSGGHLTAVTDPSEATTEYVRDGRGRVSQIVDALDRVTHFTWDAKGLPATRIAPSGVTTTWQHDGMGHITAEAFSDGTEHAFTFDAQGRRTRAVGPSGDVEYRYDDPRGRLTSIIDHLTGHRIDATWEAVTGRLSRLTRPDGTYLYQWSAQGDLVGLTLPSGDRLTQRFDAYGRLVERRFPNGVVEVNHWDDYGRLAGRVTTAPDGRILLGSSFTYDALDRRASVTTQDGETTSYTYDPLGRLTDVVGPEGASHWTYDEAGNRLSETRDGVTTTTWTYDATHRLLSRVKDGAETTYTWDEDGHLASETTGGAETTYTWDGPGRLTGVDAPGEAPQTYDYDADGRRTLREDASGTWLTTWDDVHPVAEVGGDGSTAPAFVFGAELDDPLGTVDLVGGERSWLHTDPRGSVIGETDDDGALTATWDYGPWGAPQGPAATAPLAFAARPMDAGSGLVDMRARSYDPADGRFLSADPLTPDSFERQRTGAPAAITQALGADLMQLLMNPQMLNPYAYVAGDPINAADPSGEMLRKDCLGIWIAINLAISVFMLIVTSMCGFGAVVIAAQIALAILDHLRGNGGHFGPPTLGDAVNVVGIAAGPLVKGFSAGGPLAKLFGSGGLSEGAAQLTDFFAGQAVKYTNLGLGIQGVSQAKGEHDAAVQQQQNIQNNLATMDRA